MNNSTLKICDFGSATKNNKQESGEVVGTCEFMSPEMANQDDHTYSTDIWSIGVIIYNICTGMTRFKGELLHLAIRSEPQIELNN